MTSPGCFDEATILEFARGELVGDRESAVADHLDTCDACRRAWTLMVGSAATTPDLHPSARYRVGGTFGRYRIESLIGEGGMGQVFRARDTLLRRRVALKLVHSAKNDDKDSAARLLREARAAAALSHPNAVAVFDVGEVDGLPFIAMELVDGKMLRTFVRDRRVTLDRKLRWLLQIARALDAAHRAGLVHRDIKPENVLVCSDDSIKVLDFGLAKRVTAPMEVAAAGPTSIQGGPASFRTQEGRVCGTPKYMAPEQLLGSPTEQSDQFAWGLVAYELCAGDAFDDVEPRPLHQVAAEVPEAVSALVMRAIEPSPTRRFATMGALLQVLEPLVSVAATVDPPTVRNPTPGQSTPAGPPHPSGAPPAAHGGGPGGEPSPAPFESTSTLTPATGWRLHPALVVALLVGVGVAAVVAIFARGKAPASEAKLTPQAPASACSPSQTWDGTRCVDARDSRTAGARPENGKPGEAKPVCPQGTYWDGNLCAAMLDTSCPTGMRFESGRGCVSAPAAAHAPGSCPSPMAALPGGTFKPHNASATITIAPFCLDATEVTTDAYAACVKAGKCDAEHLSQVSGPSDVPFVNDARCNYGVAERGNHPINCVVWKQGDAYCRAHGKRLPTTEEWEWAARGGERGTAFPWGGEPPRDQLCWSGISMRTGTCAVGTFPEGDTTSGVHDLSGNVWELVATMSDAMFVGGAWSQVSPLTVRSVSLNWGGADTRAADIGFRCAE